MLVLELKTYPTPTQQTSIEEAIRTTQFIRNKAIRQWMDAPALNKKETSKTLYVLSKTLAHEFSFVKQLNSTARQAATERAWNAILRFYRGQDRKPKFQKDNRSVEFKQSGWKLSDDYKKITISSNKIGTLKLKGTRNLEHYAEHKIFRVRIVRRADGYYVQFCIDANRTMVHQPMGSTIGIDVGLKHFLTDSNGETVENPRFLRTSEVSVKRLQRRHSKCKKGSKNRRKAQNQLARKHLKITRQRKDFAVKTARQIIVNNDFVVIEDLRIRNLVKNRKVSKSFSDAALSLFRNWLEYYGRISGVPVIAVAPQYTSQECSKCGQMVQKAMSERTHICSCGLILDRDWNAAKNILAKGLKETSLLSTLGHKGSNASGEETSLLELNVLMKVFSLKEESAGL
jgi:putative transposase